MRTDIKFKNYTDDEYEALCDFLIALNKNDDSHINWNWARLEWMIEHPEFDKSLKNSIGLWTVNDKIVGAAIYDMYFGKDLTMARTKLNLSVKKKLFQESENTLTRIWVLLR